MEVGHMQASQQPVESGRVGGGSVESEPGRSAARRAPLESGGVHGERLGVPERVILAPASGRFRPLPPEEEAAESDAVAAVDEEQVIGFVEGHGHSTPVRSPFRGALMGMLAHAGERVREGQPVAWLRLA